MGIKKYFYDWRTYYKLFFLIIIFAALIATLVLGIIDAKSSDEWKVQIPVLDDQKKQIKDEWIRSTNYGGYVASWISFFTNQSNLLVVIWFATALFMPWKEGKNGLNSSFMSLLVITYITVTMLIFCGLLLPQSIEVAKPWYYWITSLTLHIISPFAIIIYVLFFMEHEVVYGPKFWFIKRSWLSIIYPVIYLIAILIRGQLRHNTGYNDAQAYPYFFFFLHENVWGMSGKIWLPIAIFIILAILVGMSTLYAWIFKKIGFSQFIQKIHKNYRYDALNLIE